MAPPPSRPYRTAPAQIAVILVVGGLALMSRPKAAAPGEVEELSSRFAFARQDLYAPPVPPNTQHEVNQTAWNLDYYLWQVGASVALGDLDGDGLANDLCYSDVRPKSMVIAPAPGTGDRYAPFVVDLGGFIDPKLDYPAVCVLSDVNEDGLLDILITFSMRTPLLMLRKDMGETGPVPLTNGAYQVQDLVDPAIGAWNNPTANFVDVDGDGHLDIVLGAYFADGARIQDGGSNEPFEMNESFSHAENGGVDRIFLWTEATSGPNPSVRFTDVGDVFPGQGERRWTLAIGAADLDNDGLSDLYIANDFGPDQLLLNRSTPGAVKFIDQKGPRGFFTPRSCQLGEDSFKGMGIDFADLNNDGVFDMYVSNIASPFALQEAHFLWMSEGDPKTMEDGFAPWSNQSTELGVAHSGWSWETKMDDFDNDGEVELVQATGFMVGKDNRWADLGQFGLMNDTLVTDPGNWAKLSYNSEVDGHVPNPFYVRGADGGYVDLAEAVFPGYTPNSRSIATADVDGDGDLDMFVGNIWQDSQYFRNDAPNPGNYLGLHVLIAPGGAPGTAQVHEGHPAWREGSPAVGAMVRVDRLDGRQLLRQVDGGNGHQGQRSPDLLFGLADQAVDATMPVKLTWRDREGALHETELQLHAGWYTVVLASGAVVAADAEPTPNEDGGADAASALLPPSNPQVIR